jgi:hypothetical protein
MTRMAWEKRSSLERVRRQPYVPRPIATNPATPKQLRYLRFLADQTGTTFAPAGTSPAASAEIARLKRRLQ